MRLFYLAAIGLVIVVAVTARSSRSQVSSADQPTPPEPVTGSAVMPQPGDEFAGHQPFTPFDVGSPHDVIAPEQLSPAQRAALQNAQQQDRTDWGQVNNVYAGAAAARAAEAAAHSAGNMLNAGDLANEGVVR